MRNKGKIKIFLFLSISIFSLSMISTTMRISASLGDPLWFYDNLTPEQRLHVRKAMDYTIPRDQIIESVLQGLGTKIASPVEGNDGAYNPTIIAREYNLEKALDHMEAAFGYRYDESAENVDHRKSYFSMVILCPTSRDDRMEMAALTTGPFQEIGIDVTLKYGNWDICVPRVFDREIEGTQGFDYTHGGYDAFFIGWTGSPESDVTQWFYKENFIPNGSNLGYIDNSEVEEILDRATGSLDINDRLEAFSEFQQWFKDNLPYYIVVQLNDLWAKDPDLEGVSFSFDYPNYQNWTHPSDVVTVMTPGDFMDMNPLQVGFYYDNLAIGDIHEGLVDRTSKDANKYFGQIAGKWTISEDQLIWEFTVRDGLKWSDGTELTVDDVIFTYQSYLDPVTNCDGAESFATSLNASNVIKMNQTSVRFIMNRFNPYQMSSFTLPILQKAQMEGLTGSEWKTDAATNTEYAPVGSGPYMMDEANTNIAESSVTLIANPYYTNTRGNPDWNNPDRIETLKIELYTSAATSVAALKAGALNIVDSNVALQPYINEINITGVAEGWGEIHQTLSWGHQGFYINQFSPIWGMNPGNPLVMYPEDYLGTTRTYTTTSTTTSTATDVTNTEIFAELTPAWSVPLIIFVFVNLIIKNKVKKRR